MSKTDTTTHAADEKVWEEAAKNMLKAEMTRQGVTYAMLVVRLGALGVTDNELNLRNKVSRGRFTAVFLLQCLAALDAEWVKVPALTDTTVRSRLAGKSTVKIKIVGQDEPGPSVSKPVSAER